MYSKKIEKFSFTHVVADPDLNSLHSDKRWNLLLEVIKQNKDRAEANYNKALVAYLIVFYEEDQQYRLQSTELEKKCGWNSKEVKNLWKIINKKDSSNLVVVNQSWTNMVCWALVGGKGNQTLFLVIQHSDKPTHEKYLLMMREAVKNRKVQDSSLALLEDSVALAQGKKLSSS
jgi:hypothetical protein